jgi:ABC-type amino acid transport substrate-binding protein
MAKPTQNTLGVIVAAAGVAAVVALLTARFLTPAATSATGSVAPLSDLENILERRVIRAGYVSNPPSCIVDPTTKRVSGIVADTMQAIADSAQLKLEWTEEVGFGAMVEGLRANRYDVVPCAIWPTAARAREADFSTPLFYSGVGAYVRPNDTKFVKGLSAINASNVRIATVDGELAETIARTQFPNAQRVGVPQMSEITTMLLNVKENKADVAFVELYFAHEFLRNNPGSLVRLAPQQPVRVFPNTILLRKGQPQFKAFLDTAIEEQINLGAVERMVSRYEPAPGTFYRLPPPFSSGQ